MDKMTLNRTTVDLIDYRVSQGNTLEYSADLLAAILDVHENGSLAYALEYNSFTPIGTGYAAVAKLKRVV